MEISKIETRAIDAAIGANWKQAIELNKQILKQVPHNIGAMLRMGFAYIQIQQYKHAKKMYSGVTKLQPQNPIAMDHLERLEILIEKNKDLQPKSEAEFRKKRLDPNLFLEIPGKTKASVLVNVGQKNVIADLTIGDVLEAKMRTHKIELRTEDGEYVGTLPDDLAKRLHVFIKGGSTYGFFIKEFSLNRVVVFIREEQKSKRLARFTSFPKDIQKNLSAMEKVENVSDNDSIQKEDDEQSEEEDEDEIERLAKGLESEDKEEFYRVDSERNDDDEENFDN